MGSEIARRGNRLPNVTHRYTGRMQSTTERKTAELINQGTIEKVRLAVEADIDYFESEIDKIRTLNRIDDVSQIVDHLRDTMGNDPLKQRFMSEAMQDNMARERRRNMRFGF